MSRELGFGCKVGHWNDDRSLTGCTVVIPPRGNIASCDIRGSSPSSREIEHLHPDRKLTEIHAVVLTGGSAYGLAAADGVMEKLAAEGVGYEIRGGVVPIVPAAVILDMGALVPEARPTAASGRAAFDAALPEVATGRVGVGAGATVGKWRGLEHATRGGLGLGWATEDGFLVSALAVVNAVGDVIAEDGTVLEGTPFDPRDHPFPEPSPRDEAGVAEQLPLSTVLAVLVTQAHVDKRDVRWLAARGSDGITISVRPAHTRYDGDVVFAVVVPPEEERPETGPEDPAPGARKPLDVLGRLATQAVARAVRDAVGQGSTTA